MQICEAFGTNRYPFTEDLGKQFQIITKVSGRLEELKTTMMLDWCTRATCCRQLIAYHFEHWSLLVKKEKSIYHTLNMLSIDVTKKCLTRRLVPCFCFKQDSKCYSRQLLTKYKHEYLFIGPKGHSTVILYSRRRHLRPWSLPHKHCDPCRSCNIRPLPSFLPMSSL